MSSLQMPKVDNSIMSKKDKIALDLRGIINSKNVLSDPNELRPFETDGLTAYRQMPLLVVMPETVDEVSQILKYCNENKIKVNMNVNKVTPVYEDGSKNVISLDLVSEEFLRNEMG